MAQFLRPDSNVTQTSFTNGFSNIDESVASDADFAYGANNTAAELEVGLSNPSGTPGSGSVTFRYRIAKTNNGTVDAGGNSVTVTVRLMQGTTQIATDSAQTATGTWTQYSYTLTSGERASITDWTDLRLEFVTSASGGSPANRRGAAVSWAELEAPDAPTSVGGSFTANSYIKRLGIGGSITANAYIKKTQVFSGSGSGGTHTEPANSQTIGGGSGWFNPTNAYADDGNFVSAADAGTKMTRYGFGAVTSGEIPDGSTITAVRAVVKDIAWDGAQLSVEGTRDGSQLGETQWDGNGTEFVYTFPNNSISLTDLRNATVGADVYYIGSAFGDFIDFDYLRLEIDYGQSGGISADAEIAAGAGTGGSFTANAYIKRVGLSGSFVADSNIRKADIAGSVTADAFVKNTEGGSFTADSVIKVSVQGSLTANSNIRRDGITASLTADSYIQRVGLSGSFSADSFVKKTLSASYTADSFVKKVGIAQTFTADAFVKRLGLSGSFAGNAFVKRLGLSGSFSADAEIGSNQSTQTGSFTADSYVRQVGLAGGVTADGHIRQTGIAGSLTADAFVKRLGLTDALTANAYVERLGLAGSFTANANVRSTVSASSTADAFIKRAGLAGSFTSDAFVKKTDQTGSLTAEANVRKTGIAASLTADAQIVRVQKVTWVSPSNGSTMSSTPVLVFLVPEAVAPVSFQIELDTVSTFDSGDLLRHKSNLDNTGWEYWNGSTWTQVPQSGVPTAYIGNQARYTVQSALAGGTWYRRIRGGA